MTSGDRSAVLLHGQPGGPVGWRRVVRALDRLPGGVEPIVEDRPGYGHHPDGPGGLLANADAVIRRLDHLGIERATVAGHSWGGGVALAMAERFPDRVDGLVLVAGLGPGALSAIDKAMAAPLLGELMAWSMFGATAPFLRFAARLLVGKDDELDAALAANRSRPLWRTFLVEQRAMMTELPEIVDALDTIVAPTLVLSGDADRIIGPTVAERLADAIARAEARYLPGHGHQLPLRAPVEVAQAIIDVGAPESAYDSDSSASDSQRSSASDS